MNGELVLELVARHGELENHELFRVSLTCKRVSEVVQEILNRWVQTKRIQIRSGYKGLQGQLSRSAPLSLTAQMQNAIFVPTFEDETRIIEIKSVAQHSEEKATKMKEDLLKHMFNQQIAKMGITSMECLMGLDMYSTFLNVLPPETIAMMRKVLTEMSVSGMELKSDNSETTFYSYETSI